MQFVEKRIGFHQGHPTFAFGVGFFEPFEGDFADAAKVKIKSGEKIRPTRRLPCYRDVLFVAAVYSISALLPTIPKTKPMTPPAIEPRTVDATTLTMSGVNP